MTDDSKEFLDPWDRKFLLRELFYDSEAVVRSKEEKKITLSKMGDHNPFDLTIPLTTNIFIGFDHSKILNIKNLFSLTTGLCSGQRE